MTRMYKENAKSLNWFVGCRHECIYCKPSFQAQMKRQLKNCEYCYEFVPHSHLDRLLKPPPKTHGKDFIFFPSSGDPTFAPPKDLNTAIAYTEKYSDRTFLIQTKDPTMFYGWRFPKNVIIAITLETDRAWFETPSSIKYYSQISGAPIPYERYGEFLLVKHLRKIVVVEPILDFQLSPLVGWIKRINPEAVYVGYDNHNCKLPEPPLAKTLQLIKELERFTEVRVKTLRKAWYEK